MVSAESIGIGIRAKNFFAETETLCFQILLIFSYFLREYKIFISLKINLAHKKIQKNLMFGRKFGFSGPFMIEKISHAIGN